jgi:hypothetical protein
MMLCPAAGPHQSRAHRFFLVTALIAACGFFSLALAPSIAAQEATPTPQVTPPANAPTLSLTFTELNDSGVSGIATLYGDGDKTIVDIRVEDAGPNHPAHIHKGDCSKLDPYPAFPLTNVIDGRSTSLVDASLDELLAGDYSIDLHMSVNELGTLVVCAPITGQPTASTPATDGTGGAVATPTAQPAEPTETAEPTATAEPTETPEPTATATETATEAATPESTGVGGASTLAGDGTGGAQIAESETASLPLQALDDLGVTGTASITALNDEQTDILIQLTGDRVTGGHLAHLHLGTCDNLSNDYTLDLENIDADGFSETTVDIPFDELLTGGYAINVHASEDDYDTWFVCGAFSDATVGAVIPEVAPPTGTGTGETATETPVPTPTASVADGIETLPQTAGSGTGLLVPNTPVSASFWAIVLFGIILALSAGVVRRGERGGATTTPRWRRLGL